MADVFVAYTFADRQLAARIIATVEKAGLRCWSFERDIAPGSPWAESIGDAIKACKIMLLLVSAKSIQSHYVAREIEHCVGLGKAVLPVLYGLSETEVSTTRVDWSLMFGGVGFVVLSDDWAYDLICIVEQLRFLVSQAPGLMPLPEPRVDAERAAKTFISHVHEDRVVALNVAHAAEMAGIKAWYYERDAIKGPSYILQIAEAVESCEVMIVVVSKNSMGSFQVAKEIDNAFKHEKAFLPVLLDVAYPEFANRRKDWDHMFGTATALEMGHDWISDIAEIVKGLHALIGAKQPNPS